MSTLEVLESFEDLPFTVELELGSALTPIGDIFGLTEGVILTTDHPVNTPFVLRVAGAELGSAEIVVMDDLMSARVKKLVERPKTAGEDDGNS